MQKISQLLLEEAEAAVLDGLSPALAKLDFAKAAEVSLDRLGTGLRDAVGDGLKAYFYGIWFIEHVHLHAISGAKHLTDAAALCERQLRSIGIQPVTSKFSGLYQRIYTALAKASFDSGEAWLAMWQGSIGHRLAGPNKQFNRLALAEQYLSQGEVQRADVEFALAEGEARASTDRNEARLGRICCARLLGDTDQAHVLAVLAQSELSGWGRGRRASLWYDKLLSAQKSGSAAGLAVAWQRGHELHTAENAAMAVLMGYALPAQPQAIRKASTLRGYFPGDYAKGTRALQLLKMIMVLEEGQATKTSPLQRLHDLGRFYAKGRVHWLPEDRLVFAAAAARWLLAHKQQTFAIHLLEDSRSLSRRLSQGKRDDVLGLCADMHLSAVHTINFEENTDVTGHARPTLVDSLRAG